MTKLVLCVSLFWLMSPAAESKIHHLGYISNGFVHQLSLNSKRLTADPLRLLLPVTRYYGAHNSRISWIAGSRGLNGRPSSRWITIL